jgi:hypothetical protein
MDFASTNGTFLNGNLLLNVASYCLSLGDIIQFACFAWQVEEATASTEIGIVIMDGYQPGAGIETPAILPRMPWDHP